eukprot:Colp12_sorted_trinity150504_noHs@35231
MSNSKMTSLHESLAFKGQKKMSKAAVSAYLGDYTERELVAFSTVDYAHVPQSVLRTTSQSNDIANEATEDMAQPPTKLDVKGFESVDSVVPAESSASSAECIEDWSENQATFEYQREKASRQPIERWSSVDSPADEVALEGVSSSSSQQKESATISDDKETDKRLLKRLKNREAASRCRNRRKALIEELQNKVQELTLDKRGLAIQVQKLRDEVNMLRNLLVLTIKKDGPPSGASTGASSAAAVPMSSQDRYESRYNSAAPEEGFSRSEYAPPSERRSNVHSAYMEQMPVHDPYMTRERYMPSAAASSHYRDEQLWDQVGSSNHGFEGMPSIGGPNSSRSNRQYF